MKGIYLGAYKALHPDHDIVYQDINGLRDLPGDMMDIDLDPYDYIIATPPCNFWSRARNNYFSEYSFKTAHLLPDILKKLKSLDKPFIVENVRNKPKFTEYGIFPEDKLFVYFIGRHTIWTNRMFNTWVNIDKDFDHDGTFINKSSDRQGGENVHRIIENWLKEVDKKN